MSNNIPNPHVRTPYAVLKDGKIIARFTEEAPAWEFIRMVDEAPDNGDFPELCCEELELYDTDDNINLSQEQA